MLLENKNCPKSLRAAARNSELLDSDYINLS